MRYLLRSLVAETLKMRRTLLFWIAVVAPGVIVGLQFTVLMQRNGAMIGPRGPWQAMRGSLFLWWILMMPLFLTLEAALVGTMEHSNKQWKHLFALPVPRWSIYLAKTIVVAALGAIATLTLWAGILAGGAALHAMYPNTAAGPIGAREVLRLEALCFAASWLMLAIQLWLGLRSASFSLAVCVGMLATVVGFIVVNSARWGHLYPWTLPLQVLQPNSEHIALSIAVGVIGGIVVTAVGCWDVTHRDVL
jgi:hypothetical protein